MAVIGGGVAGLTAAYRLLERGHRVRLFEAGDSLGGLLRTFDVGGEPVECFYHHLFASDAAAIRLIDELGLLGSLVWRPSRVGVFYKERIYPFTTSLDLLRFTPIGLVDRLRLGLMALRLRREQDGSRFEGITASDWVRSNAGQRNLDVVWRPLLRGKFGAMADEVVMTWLWNKIHLRFASRSAGPLGGELLGYQLGSFGRVIRALERRIHKLGGEIETGRPVQRIASEAGRIRIALADDESSSFDAVVATVSNDVFRRISPPLGEEYGRKLEGIRYHDALCLVLSLRRPLTKFYWLNMNDQSAPFIAVVEHTNLIDRERYGGQHIVYVSSYLSRESPRLRMTTDEIFALYSPYLKRINPAFDESWVNQRWLFHGPDAQPVFTVGAASRVAEHQTPIAGLYLANMGQIYPQDRGQNYSILLGERVAGIVAADMAARAIPQYQV